MPRSLVSALPLELLLRIASNLDFSDLWSFAHTNRSCQKLARQILWRKHRLDLDSIDTFEHLIHSAMAYVCRYGTDALEPVADRLAFSIYGATPHFHWEPSLRNLLDKSIRIMLDHVVHDKEKDDTDARISRMGQLISELLALLYPALTAVFDTHIVRDIHHRLLITHIDRHIRHLLIHDRDNQQQRRDDFRAFVRFVGTLLQNEFVTIIDLQVLAEQWIAHLQQQSLSSIPPEQKIKEAELRSMALLDLLRAVVCRQQGQLHSAKEMHTFACLVKQSVSILISFKTATNISPQS
ncbi:hypothetical protein BX666DRAFT_2029803 [Dichotomocladium elegans]|nr:hypothetical protein BX666DRAFT_2029803 [Dichotomocladium elegans]